MQFSVSPDVKREVRTLRSRWTQRRGTKYEEQKSTNYNSKRFAT